MRGRPLRFLVVVVAGRGAGRALMLWPVRMPVQPPVLAAHSLVPKALVIKPAPIAVSPAATGPTPAPLIVAANSAGVARTPQAPVGPELVLIAALGAPEGRPLPPTKTASPGAVGLPPPAPRGGSRWSGSAWAIVRDGGGAAGGGALPSPLLGGSQAGIRLVYALDAAGRLAGFARAATPLGSGPAELALGGQWRPTPAPVTLFGEARLSNRRIAPAAGAFGGGTASLAGFRLEGYGQAGVIARDGISGFGDGQVRLTRTLGQLEAGLGAWGAAQRGAKRIDVGPTIGLPLKAGPAAMRLTLDCGIM